LECVVRVSAEKQIPCGNDNKKGKSNNRSKGKSFNAEGAEEKYAGDAE